MLRRKSDAGRTAAAEYHRLLKRWRREWRVPLLTIIVIAGLLAVPIWHLSPNGQFFAGIWFGAVLGMAWWIVGDPPDRVARWRQGAEGERKTARALRRLERNGWRCFHDREGGRGNLDHLVVGPAGVFLLESKNVSGTLVVERNGLTAHFADAPRHDYTYAGLAGAMRGSARRLKLKLESETRVRTWVQAVVVIWGEFPQGVREQDKVVYVAGDRLRAWLAAQPPRMSVGDQRLVQLALDAGLVAPPAPDVAAA